MGKNDEELGLIRLEGLPFWPEVFIIPHIVRAWAALARDPQNVERVYTPVRSLRRRNQTWMVQLLAWQKIPHVKLPSNNQTIPNLAEAIDYDFTCQILSPLSNALLYSSTPELMC